MKNTIQISLVIAFTGSTEKTEDFMSMLQEMVEEYQVEIVGLWPMSDSGAWPTITFKGKEDSIKRLCQDFFEDEEEASEYYETQSVICSDANFTVHSDKRWQGERNHIKVGGGFI
jgi:hypothetical protein